MPRLFLRFLFFVFVARFGKCFIIEKNTPFTLYAKNDLEFGGIWNGQNLEMSCQSNSTISRFMFVGCSSLTECRSNAQECFFNPPTSCRHKYKTGGKCGVKKGAEKDCSEIGEIPLELPWEENEEGEFFGDSDPEERLKKSIPGSARFVCQAEAGKNVSLDFFTFAGIGAEEKGHLRIPQVFIEINHNGTEFSSLVTDPNPKTLQLFTNDRIRIQCRFNAHLFHHPDSSHKSLVQGILDNGTTFEIGAGTSTRSSVSDEWGLGYFVYKISPFSVPKNLSAIKCTPAPSTSNSMTDFSLFSNILVKEAPAAPVIIDNSTVLFRLNETRELHCKFKGEPQPIGQWFRNDKLLQDHALGQRKDHFFELSLQLTPNVTQDDHSQLSNLTCLVSNLFGTAKKHFILETETPGAVLQPGSAPKEIIKTADASSSNVLVNIIFCAIILILAIGLFLLCRKYQRLRKEHEKETIDNVVLQPMLSNR